MGAVTETDRIATLDIVRGVAVMGILAMNIVAFAMPIQAYFNPLAYGDGGLGDIITWFVNFVLVDGKMRGFFSFLFGASTLLVIERAEAAGASPASTHYWRMVWLLVFGLIHLYLIWWGDILAQYALIGMVAYAFRNQLPRALFVWALGLLALQIAFVGSGTSFFYAAQAAATAPNASPEQVELWRQISADFVPLTGAALQFDLATYRGDYAGILEYRVHKMLWSPLIQLFFGGWETLAYMLLGMAALKTGFLTGAWERRRYARVALITLGIGIPAYIVLGWILYRAEFGVPDIFAVSMTATILVRPLLIVGYAALVILLSARGGALVDRIGATGRAAFTNYLGTSLVMTTVFYGYGFGLYGELDRPMLYLFVLAMWALMLIWSKPWLERFQYGPFEWLWRSLSRFSLQPMRRRPARATA